MNMEKMMESAIKKATVLAAREEIDKKAWSIARAAAKEYMAKNGAKLTKAAAKAIQAEVESRLPSLMAKVAKNTTVSINSEAY